MACLATAALLAPVAATSASAQARTADPAAVLQKQFRTGHGVAFTEKILSTERGKTDILIRRAGKFQFGTGGVAASTITSTFNVKASEIKELPEELQGVFRPEQTIRIGTTSYIKGGIFGSFLPDGKTWLKYPSGPPAGMSSMFGQLVGVTEPATLKTLLSTAKKGSGVYSGRVTFAQLWKVSKWFRSTQVGKKPTGAKAKSQVTWKLYVTAKGLVTRIVSSYPGTAVGLGAGAVTTDTRFTGWGGRVSIKPPAADDVAGMADLDLGDGLSMSRFPLG
ncbi:hypothetical protein MPTA5024_25510 [Microbispora sp. ATCC PTA-5024]|nr:hypothetical protein MPTA5024_25510 [Microbispora sp. ATCC PTA-5024]